MKLVECSKCRSNDLFEENGYMVCSYCRMKFVPSTNDLPNPGSAISVYDDIRDLLEKCKNDPSNRRRYASLILDLDPTNREVAQYLQ